MPIIRTYRSILMEFALVVSLSLIVGFLIGPEVFPQRVIHVILALVMFSSAVAALLMSRAINWAKRVLGDAPSVKEDLELVSVPVLVRFFDEMQIALVLNILLTASGYVLLNWNAPFVLTLVFMWFCVCLIRVAKSAWAVAQIREVSKVEG